VFGIVTTLQAGQPRKRGHVTAGRLFSSPERPDWLCGLPSFPFSGYRDSAFADARLGSAADDSHTSSVKVKNERSYTYIYTYSFVASARVSKVEAEMANADEGQRRNKNASEWMKVWSISVHV